MPELAPKHDDDGPPHGKDDDDVLAFAY
jgi:cytochrome bd ubiquinol oxidase subunit I